MSKVRRERDAEVARETILEAAERVFAREGFDGARIDSIATEAGYNKSLLFHYFDDKEGLYLAVVGRLKTCLSSELSEPLTVFAESCNEINADRVRLFLEMIVKRYLDFLAAHPNNLRIMAWESAEGWRTFMRPERKGGKEHQAVGICLIDFLRRAQQAGVINQDLDVRLLVINLANMCVMYLLSLPRYQWFFGEPLANQYTSLEYVRQQILQLVLHGMLGPLSEKRNE
jgi:TetR/AcrR family transcriptional regulator